MYQNAKILNFFRAYSTHGIKNINNNFIRTRVWKSGYFDKQNQFVFAPAPKVITQGVAFGNDYNIGHVSIETLSLYASLWPEGIIQGKFKKVPGLLFDNADDDVKAERRDPDCVIDLFTLDHMALEKEFKKFTNSKLMWTLVGANKWINKNEAESCSGLGYRLLVSAGIKNLVSNPHLIRDIIVATPNNLADLVSEAQKAELAKHPELANLKINHKI